MLAKVSNGLKIGCSRMVISNCNLSKVKVMLNESNKVIWEIKTTHDIKKKRSFNSTKNF